MAEPAFERLLRRDRVIVVAALVSLTALAWGYILWLAAEMDMSGMDMTGMRMTGLGIMAPARTPWHPAEFVFVFTMWVVMMIGMMAPSATPMILMYANAGRYAANSGRTYASTSWFAVGYFLVWAAFSLVATFMQWTLERRALLDPGMASANGVLGGIVLVVAGVYQWSPLKNVCLRQCQTPLTFLMRHGGFRRNATGCVLLGLHHGMYCVGCCWALMALLFVGGAMNVLWIAVLALLVLVEKVTSIGGLIARVSGLALMASGTWLLTEQVL